MTPTRTLHSKEPVFEYNQITENIFIGTNMCCQTHFDDDLIAQGVWADISLEGERLDMPFGVSYFGWLPVKDGLAPTDDQMKFGVAMLDQLIGMGKRLYVHCEHGHGRSPTLVAAYFIMKGDSVGDAIERIQKKRPTIHITPHQKKALERWYTHVNSE